MNERIVEIITDEILSLIRSEARHSEKTVKTEISEITGLSKEKTVTTSLKTDAETDEVLALLKKRTAARIGVGKTGARLKTDAYLNARGDYAIARDSVFKEVDEKYLHDLGLEIAKTCCKSKDEFLTRPDLGKTLAESAVSYVKNNCKKADVLIYVSDGLSCSAVESNAKDILPVITDGLKAHSISVSTPFFLKYGRVPAMDQVSEITGCKVVCVLIGERPGMATAESMSAYIAYNATVDMPEARRTVVSNIHSGGISPVEAGAYIVDVIMKMLEHKLSGVELRERVW